MTDQPNVPEESAPIVAADAPEESAPNVAVDATVDSVDFVKVAAKPMSQPQTGAADSPRVAPENHLGEFDGPLLSSEAAGLPGFAELATKAATLSERDVTHYSARQMRRGRDVLTRIYAVRRSVRFYPLEHPAVAEGVNLLLCALRGYFEEGVDVHLTFYEGEVLLGEQLLTEESVLFDQLVRDMTGIGVGTLSLRRGITETELTRAIAILASDSSTTAKAGGVERMTAEAELPHVQVRAVVAVERASKPDGDPVEAATAAYGSAVSLMREIDRLLRMNRHVSSAKVKGVVRSLVDNVLTNRYAMLQLTGLKNYDEYTFYHSANVAILSLALGSTVTTDYRFLSSLGVGALLHDIGKLTVDLSILNKPGPLTPEEWADVRHHPVGGAEMTALLPGVDKSAVVTILEHHMQWNGAGYPSRTPRRKQHLASRIVAVADSYDAMTSRRSYSAARVQDDAMGLLAQSAGTSLDPALVKLFIQMMGLYPPRSVVRLSGGEVAIVLAPDEHDPVRPVVRVIATGTGEFIAPLDLALIDYPELSVKGCLDPRTLNIEVEDYL